MLWAAPDDRGLSSPRSTRKSIGGVALDHHLKGGSGPVALVGSVLGALSVQEPNAPTSFIGCGTARVWAVQADDASVYALGVDNQLAALDPRTGATRWSAPLGLFHELVAAGNGVVVVHDALDG